MKNLPFGLTGAQERVIGEALEGMRSEKPMRRLLQGDVGSGKTVVAVAALLTAVESGGQGAIMAPTEVLAEQHFLSISAALEGPAGERRAPDRLPGRRGAAGGTGSGRRAARRTSSWERTP